MKTSIVGKVTVKAKHIESSEIVETTVVYEDWGDKFYYCWTFSNKQGAVIGNKCSAINKKVVDKNEFDYLINHLKLSIDSYKTEGKKIFKVGEIQKLNLKAS